MEGASEEGAETTLPPPPEREDCAEAESGAVSRRISDSAQRRRGGGVEARWGGCTRAVPAQSAAKRHETDETRARPRSSAARVARKRTLLPVAQAEARHFLEPNYR